MFSALKLPVQVLHISRTCILQENFVNRRHILRHDQNISGGLGFLILREGSVEWRPLYPLAVSSSQIYVQLN